jgi:hypothetical protein
MLLRHQLVLTTDAISELRQRLVDAPRVMVAANDPAHDHVYVFFFFLSSVLFCLYVRVRVCVCVRARARARVRVRARVLVRVCASLSLTLSLSPSLPHCLHLPGCCLPPPSHNRYHHANNRYIKPPHAPEKLSKQARRPDFLPKQSKKVFKRVVRMYPSPRKQGGRRFLNRIAVQLRKFEKSKRSGHSLG